MLHELASAYPAGGTPSDWLRRAADDPVSFAIDAAALRSSHSERAELAKSAPTLAKILAVAHALVGGR